MVRGPLKRLRHPALHGRVFRALQRVGDCVHGEQGGVNAIQAGLHREVSWDGTLIDM